MVSCLPTQAGAHRGVNTVRILNSKTIARVLSNDPPREPYTAHLPPINFEKCKQREKKALEQAHTQARRVNDRVATEVQCIFDAVSKTLPCEWQGDTMVVLVSVGGCSDDGMHDVQSVPCACMVVLVSVGGCSDDGMHAW